MVKLVGAVCILGAGTWAWRRSAAERRRELDTLADLTALLDRMGRRSGSAGPACPGCWGPWAGTGRDLSGTLYIGGGVAGAGRALGQSWRSAAEALPLGPESRTALTALGDSLQGMRRAYVKH